MPPAAAEQLDTGVSIGVNTEFREAKNIGINTESHEAQSIGINTDYHEAQSISGNDPFMSVDAAPPRGSRSVDQKQICDMTLAEFKAAHTQCVEDFFAKGEHKTEAECPA